MTYLEVLLLLLLSLGTGAHVGYLPISGLRRGGSILSLKSLNASELCRKRSKYFFQLDVSVVVMVKESILEWSMLWKFYIITCGHVHCMFCDRSLANYELLNYSVQF